MIDFPPLPTSRPSRPSLSDEIARLSAHIEAATGRLFALIREFDGSLMSPVPEAPPLPVEPAETLEPGMAHSE